MNYYRILCIPFLSLIFLLSILVDDIKGQSVEFGVTGGINISSHLKNFRYSNEDINLNMEPRITKGFQAGLLLRKNITSSFRLQTEPSLILLGAGYDEPFTFGEFEIHSESRTKLLYIQMPLLFQLSTVPSKENVFGRPFAKTTYHVTGGFFGGHLIDTRFTGTNTGIAVGIPFEGSFSNDVTPQYKTYDGGVIFGAGFEHGNNEKLGFETRAMFSVFDSGNAPELFFKPQNMAVTFSVYFLL